MSSEFYRFLCVAIFAAIMMGFNYLIVTNDWAKRTTWWIIWASVSLMIGMLIRMIFIGV